MNTHHWRRAVLGGVAVVASLVPVTGASAYSPGLPGDVGNSARFMVSEDVWQGSTNTRHLDDSDDVKTTSTGVAETHSYGWPPMPVTWPGGPITGCTDGCAAADALVAAKSDTASGTLETFARGVASVTGTTHDAAAGGFARAHLDDTITVSKDTTVILKGRVQASLDRFSSDVLELSEPTGDLDVSVRFGYCGAEGCTDERGFFAAYEPDVRGTAGGAWSTTVDESFAIPIGLKAGKTPINARMTSDAFGTVDGIGGSQSVGGRADAARNNGDPHRLQFHIVVPDDVTVTSGSGKLPIVGGKAPAPSDTTPPTLEVPAGVTADATSASGAKVNYTVTAKDNVTANPGVTCSPASGSTFAIGDTLVTCTATDAAGNKTTKTFTVHVRTSQEMLTGLKSMIAGLHPHAQRQLSPHAKLTCQGLAQVVKHADIQAKQGYLADPEPVKAAARRLAAVIGC